VWDRTEGHPAQPQDPTRPARPVHVDVEPLGIASRGELISLSTTGARVALDATVLILSPASLTIAFQVKGTVYLLSGATQRSNRDGSISFAFDFVTRQRVAALAGQLAEAGVLDPASVPAPAETDVAAPGPSGKQAELLRELRRVRHEPPPGGIERRMQTRYDMGVQAALAVLQTGNVLDGELLEISLTGCRVFTDEPNRNAVRTPVEVQFVGCGFPLRLGGEIQINRAQHAAGLLFHDIRPRIRERLNLLLDELDERDRKLARGTPPQA